MATTTHTGTSKPTHSPLTDAQGKEAYERISAASAEATDLIRNSYSTVIEGAQVYNKKLLEFAQTNSNVAFGFAQKLLGVKSPSEFLEISTEHAQKQFEMLKEQATELTALGQKIAGENAGPLARGVNQVFQRAS